MCLFGWPLIVKKSKPLTLLLLQCLYEDNLRNHPYSLLLVHIDASFIHSNALAQPSVHAKSASHHLPRQNENLWGAVAAGVSYFSPRGLVNPTRSPILTPSGGDPSQQAQPGSITPRRAVKCLLCICRRVVGELSDGHQHSMCEYSVKVPNTNTAKQYYFIILERI